MTVEAGCAIRDDVIRCEGLIHLTMTGSAGFDIESRYIVAVAVLAFERIILSLELVRG